MEKIVVGVDGSDHSRGALRWALAEAAAHGARVEVVGVWHQPVLSADSVGGMTLPLDPAGLEQAAQEMLEEALDATVEDDAVRASITRTVAEGSPGHVLVDASKDADLLVVGSHGRGGFTGLLLGSVSNQCVHHAHCPVVVVRRGTER